MLHDDPTLLRSMLKDALVLPATTGTPVNDAGAYLAEHLGGIKGWIYHRVRGKVQQALRERELGVPTVVQIPGLTTRIKTGMSLTVDGGTGIVQINGE